MNGPQAFKAKNNPTFGLVIDRFIKEERHEEMTGTSLPVWLRLREWRTAPQVLTCPTLRNHIKPRWGDVALDEIKPIHVIEWLRQLPLAPKTCGHIKGMLHMLFERAMTWELIDVQRNPIELVKVRGLGQRKKKILVLTAEQCQELLSRLSDPYRTMYIVALCTGLRVSEILALRWDHIDLQEGVLLVQQGTVDGRIGRVKTEASQDEIPLDGSLVETLLEWQKKTSDTGLVFPSALPTGGCFHAGVIQRKRLKPAGALIGLLRLAGTLHVTPTAVC